MAGETSNIRWDWQRVTTRHWRHDIGKSPTKYHYDVVEIMLPRKDTWLLYINADYIATFNTWEEAAGAAPMLYSLHKDTV